MFMLSIPDPLLIAAAAVPVVAILYVVYRRDRDEPEPAGLLLRLILLGILATALSKLLERAGMRAMDALFEPGTLLYDVVLYFGIVALAEEGMKYALLKRATWESPHFDSRFDGVVYAVFLSLGFALWENLGYALTRGMDTALLRAVTAVPGHACFGVFMGCWYAQAAALYRRGRFSTSRTARTLTVLLPALLHGAYDFAAASTAEHSAWLFFVALAAVYLCTFRLARRLSSEVRHI